MLSIVIPVYNTADYLGKCLDSILGQSYRDIEVIAVNDGSTDSSADILARYAAVDSRLRIITQSNQGHQAARAAAIAAVRGEYLCFVDSDDSLPDEALRVLMDKAYASDAEIIAGRICIEDGNRKRIFPSDIFDTISSRDYLLLLLSGRVGWNLAGKIIRTQSIRHQRTDLPKVSAGEDAVYMISLVSLCSGTVAMTDTSVYNYLMRPGSITNSKNLNYIKDNYAVADYVEEKLARQVPESFLVSFRLLCMSSSFRYGWLGSKHPLNARALQSYHQTPKALSHFRLKKRIMVWILIHFGDILSRYYFRNSVTTHETR